MTDREKFLFDLNGFLVVRKILSGAEVTELNAAVDANLHLRTVDPHSSTGSSTWLEGDKKRGIYRDVLAWEKPWCNPFRSLMTHRKLIPYLNTLLDKGWRLDHTPFLVTATAGTAGMAIHGSGARAIGGTTYYRYQDGVMRCGTILLQLQLTDIADSDGGLCVIPGSHKSNLPPPEQVLSLELDRDIVRQVPCAAGDLIILNEATLHGSLPWTGKHERRTLFYRYSPGHMHHAGGYHRTQLPAWTAELSEAEFAVLQPPYFHERPAIADDGETVERPGDKR